MEVDSCQSRWKPIVVRVDGRWIILLVVSFVLELKGLTEGFMIMSCLYTEVSWQNGVIHGEKSTSVGSDRMAEIALISILVFTYVLVTVV